MQVNFPFIAVDWGTTQMRATLCEAGAGQSRLLRSGTIEGPGITRLHDSAANTLFTAIQPWVHKFGKLDVLMGGMVGSNIGWHETPYLSCPLSPEDLASSLNTFTARGHRMAIVPGLSCVNTLGQPDVMRGEEIQVLGWMMLSEDASKADRILCLPGTHTKWVQLKNGRITRFTTSLTGELYALLRQHSVLVPKGEAGAQVRVDMKSFQQGLMLAIRCGDDLLHALFSTRSSKLTDKNAFGDASSFLSGLLIGADVCSALKASNMDGAVIELIGEPDLCKNFTTAIKQVGHMSRVTDGNDAVHAGFLAIAGGKT